MAAASAEATGWGLLGGSAHTAAQDPAYRRSEIDPQLRDALCPQLLPVPRYCPATALSPSDQRDRSARNY